MDDNNLNVISPNEGLGDIAKAMGIEVPEDALNEGIKNTGFAFYEHEPGDYVGLIGLLGEPVYKKEIEGKSQKVKPDTPGAIRSYAMLPIMLIDTPKGKVVDDSFNPLPNMSYGQLVFQQYCTLLPDKQYSNKRIFGNLKFQGLPQLDIVQGEDNDYVVKLELLKYFYYGAPVLFTLEKAKSGKGIWLSQDGFKLRNQKLDKEIIEKRKKVADAYWSKIIAIREAEKAEREAKSSSAEEMKPSEDVVSPDSLLKDEGYEV